jgi:hypothetical protein
MQPRAPRRRLRVASAALAAALLSMAAMGEAVAESASPFGDAARVADGALDNLRGGFAATDGSMLRFGLNLETSVNGRMIASLSISNDANGKITATERNFGRTFVLQADGSVQIRKTMPGHAHPHHGAGDGGTRSSGLPTTVTMPLNNPVAINATQQNSASGVIVTTTLVPVVGASVASGGLLASTGLLPNGNGVMTLIQNTRSNVVIHALNTLNVQISGLGNDAVVRSGTVAHSFANSMNLSVRH